MTGERRELLNVAATHALAAELAAGLGPGEVLALVGELGAGKTEFVRGLCAALGVPASAAVCSPSYLLLNVYRGGRLVVSHYDAYFMTSSDDLERAGFDDRRRAGDLVVVEWADRVADALPADALWLTLAPGPPSREGRLAAWARARPVPDRAGSRGGPGG